MVVVTARRPGSLPAAILAVLLAAACTGDTGGGTTARSDAPGLDPDASTPPPGPDAGPLDPDAGTPPPLRDTTTACAGELCWNAPPLGTACGDRRLSEDFSSGRYAVHAYAVSLTAGAPATFTVRATAGTWSPALLAYTDDGTTVFDGDRGLDTGAVHAMQLTSGRDGTEASISILTDADLSLTLLVTSLANVDGVFDVRLPTDAVYELALSAECTTGGLVSPPNFDPDDVAGGYYLLPPSEPPGLYTRKADGCSRGTRLLIDVIYTAALRWREMRPDLPALDILDLNEGPCSGVDHATHDDGTHVDLHVECGTEVACPDDSAAITLAQIFVDTGQVCGIIFNDTAVQRVVNDYFGSRYTYEPWFGTFMRTVSGHTSHFHVRVMKPDGTCN